MKTLMKRIFALVGILALGLSAVHAQEDALLDALVKKGVLSDQEAEDVRAGLAKDYAQTPAGKLSISNHITQLKIYGDARMRFEYLDEVPQDRFLSTGVTSLGHNSTTTERNRYRLRIGADYTFTDNFLAGFELESGTAGDSANQSMGNGFGKFSIQVGLIYLQWKPTDWLTLTGGKQRNLLYTTDMVWDPDINPEGATEVLSFHPTDEFSIGLTAGQFLYADNAENNPAVAGGGSTLPKSDIWMFAQQLPIQYNFDKDTFIKEVPGFTAYMGGGNSGTGGTNAVGAWAGSAVTFVGPHAADDLQILTAPGEFDWKAWDLPFRVYWDFALNLEGHDRVQNVYFASTAAGDQTTRNANMALSDNVAWLAGVQVGQNKKKGDWSIKGDFRQVGVGSVDPNINDSDWGDSFLNQQGFKIQSVYNFTDFLTGSLTFFDTWNYKEHLLDGESTGQAPGTLPIAGGAGGGTNGNTIAGGTTTATSTLVGVNATQRVQVDLIWKF